MPIAVHKADSVSLPLRHLRHDLALIVDLLPNCGVILCVS